MIRINLLPVKELEAESVRRRELTIGGAALALAFLVMGGVYFFQWREHSRLENELTDLRSEIQALNVKVKEVGELQNKIKDLRGKNKIIADLNQKKSGPVQVMENLAIATPTTLWLTDLKESGGNLVLNGVAADNKTVADFISGLEASKYFRGVELVETTQGTGPTGGFKRFSIKTGVLYQPAPAAPVDAKAKTTPAAKKQEKRG
jgi:type IV pilus assembly protein PilN